MTFKPVGHLVGRQPTVDSARTRRSHVGHKLLLKTQVSDECEHN